MNNHNDQSALAIGQLIESLDVDPREWVESAIKRAEAADSVFICVTAERAREEAEQARHRQAAGHRLGLLDGVPLGWKDLIDVAGSPTTAGTKVLAGDPATRDAPAVSNASAAGLVSLGKTNMTELAYSGLGLNPHYGTPHATPGSGPARAPGGSSSGSAVAVAIGIVPAAMGSDTAGSLRVPAAFNGLSAYRPSTSRHDLTGVVPLAPTLDTIGVIAQTLEDCFAVDDCMRQRQVAVRQTLRPDRLTFVYDEPYFISQSTQPAVRDNLNRHLQRLEAQGARVLRQPVQAMRDTLDLITNVGWLGGFEAYHQHQHLLQQHSEADFDSRVYRRLQSVREARAETAVTLYLRRKALMKQLNEELSGAILVMPTVAHVAPLLSELEADPAVFADRNLATLRLTMVASLLDCPALTMPTGTDVDGQHTSAQWLLSQNEDERLVRSALALGRS